MCHLSTGTTIQRFFAWMFCHRRLVQIVANKHPLNFAYGVLSSNQEQTATRCIFSYSVKMSYHDPIKILTSSASSLTVRRKFWWVQTHQFLHFLKVSISGDWGSFSWKSSSIDWRSLLDRVNNSLLWIVRSIPRVTYLASFKNWNVSKKIFLTFTQKFTL